MKSSLRILHLEDDPNHAELVQSMLEAEGIACDVVRVENRADFLAAVEQGGFDIIFADYSLPEFDGMSALTIAQEKSPELPFIFISGMLGEELAIESLKNGATDYVIKQRPSRLVPAVRRAIQETEERIERRRAVKALRESEEKFRSLAEQSPNMIFINQEGRIVYANKTFEEMMGYSREELCSPDFSFLTLIAPESLDLAKAHFTSQMKGEERGPYEYSLIAQDGKKIEVMHTTKLIDYEGKKAILGIITDVTKRKILEDQLRQAQKLESLGTLAGGIAHDFNNVLGIILGYTALLEMRGSESTDLSDCVEGITKSVERGSSVVKQLLTFARKNDVLFGSVNVNTTIEELAKMLEATFPKTITFSLQLDKSIPAINADAGQLHQALLNLCVNARDAMPKGGNISIGTGITRGETLRNRFPDAREEEYVCISVTDTGKGVDEGTRSKIFEPFYTTKGVGKGTGLGLAVVYGVATSHYGFTEVETEPGRGATFRLHFPVPRREVKREETPPQIIEEVKGGSETILLVEDEEPQTRLLKSLLEATGYKVLTAGDGISAMEVYTRLKDNIALVITDLNMPKLDGWEVVQRMQAINPDVRVIVASGYLDPNARSEMLKAGANVFVQKPYVPTEIMRRIREVIDGGSVVKEMT